MPLTFPSRYDTDSVKWSKYANRDILPLWVADSDFQTPSCITEALHHRVTHGVFGYGTEPKTLSALIVQRLVERYQWQIEPKDIVYLPGLVTGLNLSVRAFSTQDHSVLCPDPVYPPFKAAIKNAQRKAVYQETQLIDNRWLPILPNSNAAKDIQLAMMCNPLNPGGTVFRRQELLAFDRMAKQHDWVVCSDEIHCDLLLDEAAKHVPYASLNADAAQRSITLMAPSKTFNIAGLGCSWAIIQNPQLRRQFKQQMAGMIPQVNVLGFVAAEAAYRDGEAWLQHQLAYLRQQYQRVYDGISEIDGLTMAPLEATYLAWIDASVLKLENPHAFFEQHGVGLSPGSTFGHRQYVRLNFACSEDILTKALKRMALAVESLSKQ